MIFVGRKSVIYIKGEWVVRRRKGRNYHLTRKGAKDKQRENNWQVEEEDLKYQKVRMILYLFKESLLLCK